MPETKQQRPAVKLDVVSFFTSFFFFVSFLQQLGFIDSNLYIIASLKTYDYVS